MTGSLITMFIAAQICTACTALANDADSSPLDNPVLAVVLIESGLALNAKLVASYPNEVGGLMAAFGIPYSIALTRSGESESAKWVVPVMTAAYAAYYLNLDENENSETEIFQQNMIGMHALIAIGAASGFLLDGEEKENSFNQSFSRRAQATYLHFFPLADGGRFRLMHRF